MAAESARTLARIGWVFLMAALGSLVLLVLARVREPELPPAVKLSRLSPEDRAELYRAFSENVSGFWEVVPEPRVGRIGQKNRVVHFREAEVRLNDAGMRASRSYESRSDDAYRIVCLGDSFVFGTGVPEHDRFCDQLEVFYNAHGVAPDGRPVETLALGIGSWGALEQAQYLTSRLSSYAPDAIIVLSVENDISSPLGVTGAGFHTASFSPAYRSDGSGVFQNQAGGIFRSPGYSILNLGNTATSLRYWKEATDAFSQLARLQHRRDGRILFSVLDFQDRDGFLRGERDLFTEIYKEQMGRADLDGAPYFVATFFAGRDTRLEHDPHPNRRGHSIIRDSFVLALGEVGWIPLPPSASEKMAPGLRAHINEPVNTERLEEGRRRFVEGRVREELDFRHLDPDVVHSFFGGIFPESWDDPFGAPPWGSVRSGFVLRRPLNAETLRLVIGVPDRVELFPLTLQVSLGGIPAAGATLRAPETGAISMEVPVPTELREAGLVDVEIRADRYFCTPTDHRMRSYRPLLARFEESATAADSP